MNPRRKTSRIRRRWLLYALIGCGLLTGREAAAQDTGRRARPDYASFRIITERNIFNANRSGGPARPSGEVRAPGPIDAFRLVGIMDYDKGRFAFFDGTNPDYRRALQSQATIAGFALTNMTADRVTLEAEGKKIELEVGMQVRREGDGQWELAPAGDLPPAVGASPPSGSSSTPSASSGGDAGGGLSEVLKRLMQQREQE